MQGPACDGSDNSTACLVEEMQKGGYSMDGL